VPWELYERIKSEPVQLYTHVNLTLYRPANTVRIMQSEFKIPGVGYCGLFRDFLTCRSALHQPDRLFTFYDAKGARIRAAGGIGAISGSVAQLGIDPIISFTLQIPPGSDTIVTGEPVAHLERDFNLNNVHLEQYAITQK
jgi:hypothetical protein